MRFVGRTVIFFIGVFFLFSIAHAGNIDSANKYAEFLDAVGPRINFGTTEGDVTVTDSAITGYAWSTDYGWINLAPSNGGVANDGNGNLSGYAWGEGTGWINFDPTNGGVSIDTSTGDFSGYAWAQNIGWISFNCADEGVCGTNDYKVQTSWPNDETDPPPTTGGGGSSPDPDPESEGNRPVITLIGATSLELLQNSTFSDPGATAFDVEDGNLTSSIVTISSVNTANIGTYIVRYDVTDSDGNAAIPVLRTVDVIASEIPPEENIRPVVTVIGEDVITVELGDTFIDPGATAFDQEDGDISGDVVVTETINTNSVGSYVVSYDVTDSQGLQAVTKTRIVDVVDPEDMPAPPDSDDPPPADDDPDSDPSPFPIPIPNIPIPNIPILDIPLPIPDVPPEIGDSPVTKTVTTVGAIGSGIALVSQIDLLTLPFRLGSLILSFLGLRKKYTPWGVVYDSVTKQPIDPAYVVLADLRGHELDTSITDIDGRYGFLTHPGTYRIVANKTNYAFPSQKLVGKTKDELYADLYFGEEIRVDEQDAVITKNIPLDPVGFDWNEFAKKDKGLMRFYSRFDLWFYRLTEVFYYLGFVVAIVALFAAPGPYNIAVFGLYIFIAVLRILGLKPKRNGHVSERVTGNPLSFGILRVYAQGIEQEISKRITDAYGRYYALVPKGEYFITFDKKNADGTYTHVFTSNLIKAKRGIISEDIKL